MTAQTSVLALVPTLNNTTATIAVVIFIAVVLYLVVQVRRQKVVIQTLQRAPASLNTREIVSPSAETWDSAAIIRGEDQLTAKYVELRSRPNLAKVQATWAGEYDDFEEYFREESAWLNAHPDVKFERIAVGQDRHIDAITRHESRHKNLTIFLGTQTARSGRQFELYLCTYKPKTGAPTLAGVFVVNNGFNKRPEFGVVFDGPTDTQYCYTLQDWFQTIPRKAIESAPMKNVWTYNAETYDSYVNEHSSSDFLRDFISFENTVLENVIREAGPGVSLLEFGSGTGRTFAELRSRPAAADNVRFWTGLENSDGMNHVARRKRDKALDGGESPGALLNTFFFSLDGAGRRASRVLWNGHLELEPTMNDADQLRRSSSDIGRYSSGERVVCCLLNTLGVLDAETRANMLENMVTAATTTDSLVVSVFARDAFPKHARPLYRALQSLVGEQEITDDDFNDGVGEFKSGYYFSHWFHADEIDGAFTDAGAVVRDHHFVMSHGDVVGHVVVGYRAAA
jgi:hypothetical protein